MSMLFLAVLMLERLAGPESSAGLPGCTITDLRKVPPGVFGAESWKGLYQSFRKYRSCDHGGEFSSSYDEDVIRLLVDRWEDFPNAAPLFARSPVFQRFVERHVNGTALPEALLTVSAHVRERCPQGMSGVCKRLAECVTAALSEQGPR